MQFFQQMEELKLHLEKAGASVFLPEAEESERNYQSLPANERPVLKKKFIDAHLSKIKRSDSVLIANYTKHGVDGYIGPNTLIEIAFAYALGKKIYLLNAMADQPCKDEIDGLAVTFLNTDLSRLLKR